jgi:fatty acid desaturase
MNSTTNDNVLFSLFKSRLEVRNVFGKTKFFYIIFFLTHLCFLYLSFYYVLFNGGSVEVFLLATLGFAFFSVQIAVVSHDLSHNQVFENKFLNRLLAKFFLGFLCGISEGHFRTKHNTHHVYTNNAHHDPDLGIPFRFYIDKSNTPLSLSQRITMRYQHILFFLSLPFVYLYLLAQALVDLCLHLYKLENFIDFVLIVTHFGVLLYCTFTYLPNTFSVIFWVTYIFLAGLYIGLVFAPNLG